MSSRSIASIAALVVSIAAALVAGSCTPELCTRHSDCPAGYQCSTSALCERLPDAGAGGGVDAGDGEGGEDGGGGAEATGDGEPEGEGGEPGAGGGVDAGAGAPTEKKVDPALLFS
jgi:hypothetical protein